MKKIFLAMIVVMAALVGIWLNVPKKENPPEEIKIPIISNEYVHIDRDLKVEDFGFVKVGDDFSKVKAVLGEPNGTTGFGITKYYYHMSDKTAVLVFLDENNKIYQLTHAKFDGDEIILPNESLGANTGAEATKGISPDEAVELCQMHLGEKDDDKFVFKPAEVHTGRKISYSFECTVELNGEKIHIVRVLWTDENDSVWSTIGFVAVSETGDKIFEAELIKDGVYEIFDVLVCVN